MRRAVATTAETMLSRALMQADAPALLLAEGVFAGISGGAALHVALRLAQPPEQVEIMVLVADRG
jgi:cysteine synthase